MVVLVFSQPHRQRSLLAATIQTTVLGPNAEDDVLGFDCGPGNALMDAWCQQHLGHPFDAGGAWAATGKIHAGLLAAMMQEPYFGQPAPKSTGRDLFNPDWLAEK